MNNSIKVMIVDDEHLVRNLLKKCIDWESIGMEIVAEASCGEDAFELVEQYHPDLIFTDICMTNIDGIAFGSLIIKKHPNIKVVVVTGYDDFKYAQRSIQAGIKDYILKPIDDEILLDTALKMKGLIEEEHKTLAEYNGLKKQFLENLPFLKERFFNELIQRNIDLSLAENHMEYLDFKFRNNTFQVVVVEIIFKQQGSIKEEEKIKYRGTVLNTLKKYFKEMQEIHLFFDMNYRITILCNERDGILEKTLTEIKTQILDSIDQNYCIGVGSMKIGLINIEKSYREALESSFNAINIIKYYNGKKPNKLIDDIKEYLRLNLGEHELSLSKVAQVFFVNPSYLSRIFKKEMGLNFMEYVTKLRIDTAIHLLRSTDLRAYEIGEKIGIPDSSYFSICFKKYTGVSVSEYKKGKNI